MTYADKKMNELDTKRSQNAVRHVANVDDGDGECESQLIFFVFVLQFEQTRGSYAVT